MNFQFISVRVTKRKIFQQSHFSMEVINSNWRNNQMTQQISTASLTPEHAMKLSAKAKERLAMAAGLGTLKQG